LDSQGHHIGSAFHYKVITIPLQIKNLSTVQAMIDGKRTEATCEEIESLLLRIETASRWQADILNMWKFAGA
jgi:hypothetical protein